MKNTTIENVPTTNPQSKKELLFNMTLDSSNLMQAQLSEHAEVILNTGLNEQHQKPSEHCGQPTPHLVMQKVKCKDSQRIQTLQGNIEKRNKILFLKSKKQ